jgi:ribosomal-protein-alanine N-acetyltransferase
VTAAGAAPEVHLDPMRRRHLPGVLRIERQVYPRPWTPTLFASELNMRGDRHYVVARVGGKVVGYAGLMFGVDEAHVTNIAVDPRWQRRKIGTVLLLHQVQESIRRACDALTLEVRASNGAAQDLYRRFGFVTAGVRRNYYTESNEDALIMWLYELRSPAVAERMTALAQAVPVVVVTGGSEA